ncbi:hypothetical protein MJG53_006972 [Ovis ammon polii x Ovis aries]|uniref:IQ domain-containing protein N n=2 Tax=Ovis TaxID=9935 RepID=A0A836AF89_SHEEP|nr:hypothetical protein JEQ12_016068 [Ovis aries]KAI4583693.1 hypothetical protein MJG53_006972 [Ovis ammon polii x Ovis aries]
MPQSEPPSSKETLLEQRDKDKTVVHRVPRLRAVLESQAFRNVLVDEMDMMLSRAATLIQANWRGYRLRQKLISQMMAAKAIQEAWRRFNTRRLLRSGKTMEKKAKVEEGDIPYHPPQQVRFQHPEEGKSLLAQPTMVSKETQFPSSDSLAAYTHQLALLQSQGTSPPGMCSAGGPSITFLPHQTVAIKLPCPVSLDAKCRPCLMTRTVRSTCLVQVEGDTMKTKQITARADKAGATGPPPSGRCAQAVQGQFKTQTQAPMEAEVLKMLPRTGPAPVINKTLSQPGPTMTTIKTPFQMYPAAAIAKTSPQPCPVPMVTIAKTPPQMYLAAAMTKIPPPTYPAAPMTKTAAQTCPAATTIKTPLQSCLAAMMNKTLPQPCPMPTVTVTKAPPQVYPPAPVAKIPPQTCPPATATKTPLQSCLAAMMSKIQPQPCPGPMITITKTSPQPCPATQGTKTPAPMRPTASMTNTTPQTRPAKAAMTKAPPQLCLLASMIRSPTLTRPAATATKVPPQPCAVPLPTKIPPQTRPAPMGTKTPLQTCQMATMSKTPSHQMFQGATAAKTAPPQTRLAAMITKTPAQLRSVATILRTLCLPPSAAGNLKPPFSAAATAGISDTSSHTCLSGPKARGAMNARQATGAVKVSSRSYLTERKVECFPASHLGAGAPKPPAGPPLEGEKIKVFSQKQGKTETASHTSMAVEMPGELTWAKVANDRTKRAHPRTDALKVQSRMYGPARTAGAPLSTCLPQAQLAPCSTTGLPQAHLLAELTKALPQEHVSAKLAKAQGQGHPPAQPPAAVAQPHLSVCLSKTLSQAHLPAKLMKAQSQAQLATAVIKVQSQGHLPTGLTKAQSQAQLVTDTAKSLYAAHQAAELSSKTQSQPLLVGFKASTQPCQHTGALPRAKPEDRLLSQLPSHSYVQGKATLGLRQGAAETQNMLVPLLASAGHTTCNADSWGDSRAARAQPSTTSAPPPSQEELAASQLASLCAELAAVLGSQEDLRALLAKALSQGEVRAALNQALSKEVLGATMAKALPQGILGTVLVKALSWGELGTSLSRALSRGELTKAIQSRLADVLSKALTEEERATLSQALCQGISRVPPSGGQPQGAKVPQQLPVVPKETMQRTRSPNHKRACKGPRQVTKETSSAPPQAATVSKAQLHAPKACTISAGPWPDSVAPGRCSAPKRRDQVDPGLFQASPGNKLTPTLSRTAIPGKEKNQTRGSLSRAHGLQEGITGHILGELVASMPQGPDNELCRSASQGSTDYGLDMSNSQSSLRSCSSLSLSTTSMASMAVVDVVEEEPWEASLDRDFDLNALLSAEAVERSQGPRSVGETEGAGHRHLAPSLHDQSSADPELIPILHQSSLANHMTLSVHWDSEDEGDVSSDQSSMNLKESLSQAPYGNLLARSLSLSNVASTVYEQPSVAAPNLYQAPVAKAEDSCLGQEASVSPFRGMSVGRSQDAIASDMLPDVSRGTLATGMFLGMSQGPEDTAMSGGQAWNSTIPSVAVGPRGSTVAPGGTWEPARGTVPWDVVGSKAAVDPRQPRELVASVQAVEKIIIHAVVIIQACARGFLVRRTIRVWHQWAIIIQAAWRGYRVRRDLARLCRAATIIQAAWRGFIIRQSRTQQMLLQNVWAKTGSGARTTSDHRCFQSCQPHVCALCQSLTSGLGSPPSVVMLVGSSPRTCHTCGHTLPTRVVHGTGRGAASQAGVPRGCLSQSTAQSLRQPVPQAKAATAIQSAWRGFVARRRLKQQQEAAKMLQATWRGHSARASLTTDALLGPAVWDNSRHTQWPGV